MMEARTAAPSHQPPHADTPLLRNPNANTQMEYTEMADVFQTQYRDEFVEKYEQKVSKLRATVTTETQKKGNATVFLIAGSGSTEATTRGANGLIQASLDDLTQVTVNLVEWHDLRKRTSFNIFISQGDGRRIMQDSNLKKLNQKIDQDIIGELSTATQNTGAATTASTMLVLKAMTILGNNEVEMDGNIYGIITPAFHAYLMTQKEFASADYSMSKPFDNSPTQFRWNGVNWIVHSRLPGRGTNAEKCFMYHKSAIGHALDSSEIQTDVGYNGEQDYSYSRATAYMGSKLLQNSGVVVMNHDGSALVSA